MILGEELISLRTDQLLDRFGSGGHKPGSGSAAALLGLISCKLIQTVVTLSLGRDSYKDVHEQLTLANQDIVAHVEPVLLSAMQNDSDQFDLVIRARREHHAESDPTRKRRLASRMLAELRTATDIPISIAESCLTLSDAAFTVFDLGFQSARGDSGVAISAALAGCSGAISIVYLNLCSFRGGEWAVKTRSHADTLAQRLQESQVQLIQRVNSLQRQAESRNS